jgi:hypothetical protein
MRHFVHPHDYRLFARSVILASRYVFEPHVEEFLQTVAETSLSKATSLPTGAMLYRAQLGHELQWQPVDPNDPEGEHFEVPGAYPETRMKPPRGLAREGRVNPKGIPCLYLADDANTAMAETRPSLGSYISLGKFVIHKPLRIITLPEPELYFPKIFMEEPHYRELDREESEHSVWGEIAYAFSEPVIQSDDRADYAPTQILAEIFRKSGFDGLRYKSRLGEGHSIALFDLENAELCVCGIYQTRSVSFSFDLAGNPYYKRIPIVTEKADM